MTAEKAIRIQERPKLPADLSKPSAELDDYLSTLKESSEADQRRQIRYAKMSRTRQQNALVKPNAVVEVNERSATICNDTIGDSTIIVEKRVGYRLTCPRCCWSWTWFGRKDRFFVSCSRCHKSFKLNWRS